MPLCPGHSQSVYSNPVCSGAGGLLNPLLGAPSSVWPSQMPSWGCFGRGFWGVFRPGGDGGGNINRTVFFSLQFSHPWAFLKGFLGGFFLHFSGNLSYVLPCKELSVQYLVLQEVNYCPGSMSCCVAHLLYSIQTMEVSLLYAVFSLGTRVCIIPNACNLLTLPQTEHSHRRLKHIAVPTHGHKR